MIHLLKFTHLILTLGLLSLVFFHFLFRDMKYLKKIILWFALFAMLTGTLLVYPAHFTFHTPWIRAAYVFAVVFVTGIIVKDRLKTAWMRICVYLMLCAILVLIVHDAVLKSTFLF
jgi:hypothetical protein